MKVWTDSIRRVKIALVVAAVAIAVVSLVVSHALIRDLQEEEVGRMAVWAEAMRSLISADETTDLNLVLKVINGNNSIHTLLCSARFEERSAKTAMTTKRLTTPNCTNGNHDRRRRRRESS